MPLIQYQTDNRLWMRAALMLFVVSLWIPWIPSIAEWYPMMSPMRLATVFWNFAQDKMPSCNGPYTVGEWVEYYFISTYFFLPAVLFSIVGGWAFQGAIVFARGYQMNFRIGSEAGEKAN